MYDIVSAEGIRPESFSFSKIYFLKDVQSRILKAKNAEEAFKLKSRNSLVFLEDYKEDIGLIRQFGEGNSCFLIDLSRIILSSGYGRAVELAKTRRFLSICSKYGIPFAFASFAKNPDEMRTSRELINIGFLLGLNAGQSKFALERLKDYLG